MRIVVNHKQTPAAGYTPRKASTIENVARIEAAGVGRVRVYMQFTDHAPTFDHVASVSVFPDTE